MSRAWITASITTASALLCTIAATHPVAAETYSRTVARDHMLFIGHFTSLHEDCTSLGDTVVRPSASPSHGALSIKPGKGYARFTVPNPRVVCNDRPTAGTEVSYTPDKGYVGPDMVSLSVISPSGQTKDFTYTLEVK